MTDTVRVMVADDHPVFRDGLASLLDPLEGIEVVARAADGAEAVALAAEHGPDVIVMDVQMPDSTASRRRGRSWPPSRTSGSSS